MPELPEVETTKTSLKPLIGLTVSKLAVYQPKLRWSMPDDLSSLVGYTLADVSRRAKYLILTFKSSTTDDANFSTSIEKKLIIHLGMSGSLQLLPVASSKRKHDHLIVTFINSTGSLSQDNNDALPVYQLHYHDPRRFGAVLWFDEYSDKLLTHLGPEPLEDTFNADYLYQRIWRLTDKDSKAKPVNKQSLNDSNDTSNVSQTLNNKKTKAKTAPKAELKTKTSQKRPIVRPIKSVIMDQAFVVGVGNIYATESLFLSGIHPLTPANTLNKKQLEDLVDHIKSVLATSIELGGSTLKDFTVADGQTGYFQHTLLVYGKHNDPCPTCTAPIEKVTITGRASTFCSICQPL